MESAPKSLRLHIAIFGRVNTGKSSLLNLISGQDVTIVAPCRGTTTDTVEKTMELPPLGPVVFFDTAGVDDDSELGARRREKALRYFDRADVILLVCEAGVWSDAEREIVEIARAKQISIIAVVNKCDLNTPSKDEENLLLVSGIKAVIRTTAARAENRDRFLNDLKSALMSVVPDDFLQPPPLLGDLLPRGGTVIFIIPLDIQAPKGRLILPQVMALRDALDHNCKVVMCKTEEYPTMLAELKTSPQLVVCDSQVVDFMVANTPSEIPCTTFSILLARQKGDLNLLASGAAMIDNLRAGDKILIAEACTHHAADDDIGRKKIPALLAKHCGGELVTTVVSGHDFPENLDEYKLVIHCGGCMLNRRETLARLHTAASRGVAITNYGMAISHAREVLARVLSPFPEAREIYLRNVNK